MSMITKEDPSIIKKISEFARDAQKWDEREVGASEEHVGVASEAEMLAFAERMVMLDAALSKNTPESLLTELQKNPAYGETIMEWANLPVEDRQKVIRNGEVQTVHDEFIIDISGNDLSQCSVACNCVRCRVNSLTDNEESRKLIQHWLESVKGRSSQDDIRSYRLFESDKHPADVKSEQHARYDDMCKAVASGDIEFKPAQKSKYSASSNFIAKPFPVDFKLDVIEEYSVYNSKEPVRIMGVVLKHEDCPVSISLDMDWEGITLSQGAGWMDNEGDMVYIHGMDNLIKLRDMLDHILKGK